MTAPDITPGYPSGGEKIGPAWDLIWSKLGDTAGEWVRGLDFATRHAAEAGLHPDTVVTLMRQASNRGLLQKRILHHRAQYRRV